MECHSVWTLVGCRVLLLTFRLKRAQGPVIRRQAPDHIILLWSYIGIRTKIGLLAVKLDSQGLVRNDSAFFYAHFEA